MSKRVLIVLLVMSLVLVLAASPALAKKSKRGKNMVSTGTVLLGGALDLSLYTGKQTIDPDGGDKIDTDLFSIGMDGLAGYFVMRGLEVGGILVVEYDKEGDDDGEQKDTEWGIGPQVGYFYPVNSDLTVFGMLPLGYMKHTTEYNPDAQNADNTETVVSGFFGEPRGGVVYNLNSKLGLFGALYLRYFSGSGNQDTGDHDTDFDFKESQYGLKVGLFGFL